MFQIFKNIILILIAISCKPYVSNQNVSLIQLLDDTITVESEFNGKISGSKWTNKPFGDECVNSLEFFKNDTFSFDCNCEVLDSTFGKWEFTNDTLILEQIGSYYSNNIKDDIDKMKWKAILRNDTIIFKYAYRWNPLFKKFYDKPTELNEVFNKFIRNQ